MTETDETRKAARRLLREGYATPAEIAKALGRSRQIVLFWAKGTNWQQARAARIIQRLQKAIQRATKGRPAL